MTALWRLAILNRWADIPRLSKAGWLCASKIPEMRTDGAVSKVAKPPYGFPRSAPYGIKEASRLFTNRPVCANKDAARHLFNGAATPPWKGGEWPSLNILSVLDKKANLQCAVIDRAYS